jgi:hypothetical protein
MTSFSRHLLTMKLCQRYVDKLTCRRYTDVLRSELHWVERSFMGESAAHRAHNDREGPEKQQTESHMGGKSRRACKVDSWVGVLRTEPTIGKGLGRKRRRDVWAVSNADHAWGQ